MRERERGRERDRDSICDSITKRDHQMVTEMRVPWDIKPPATTPSTNMSDNRGMTASKHPSSPKHTVPKNPPDLLFLPKKNANTKGLTKQICFHLRLEH